MRYRVELARQAEGDLEALYFWVVARAPLQGATWFNGLERAILSLERMPKRYRIAFGLSVGGHGVRTRNYGRRPHVYRVFFVIDERAKVVRVLHIRRGACRAPVAGDLED